MDDNKTVVEDNAMDLFMSGPFLQWVRKELCCVESWCGFNLNLDLVKIRENKISLAWIEIRNSMMYRKIREINNKNDRVEKYYKTWSCS